LGDLSEFSLRWRVFLKTYRWRRIDPLPWTPLRKPLAQCRVALVTSAAFSLPGQPRFDETMKGGDSSFREIPADVDVSTLVENHPSELFDHEAMHQDPNLVFPVDRLRELVEQGRIGSVAPRHLSFMGSITAPGRLVQEHAPRAARLLAHDGVDVALLVPV